MPVNFSDYEPYIQHLKTSNKQKKIDSITVISAGTTAATLNTLLVYLRDIGLLDS